MPRELHPGCTRGLDDDVFGVGFHTDLAHAKRNTVIQ